MRRPEALPLALTLLTRVAVAALVRVAPAWDGFFYARYAARIAAGLGYAAEDAYGTLKPTAFYPVGYPGAMALALPVVRDARLAAVTVNLVAAVVAVLAVVRLGRAVGGDDEGERAGLIYALYPGAVLWSAAAMTETLTGALLAVAAACAVRPTAARSVGAGAALGIAALVRPQSLLVLPMVLAAPGSARARITRFALAAVTALALVAPWTARNCARLDACALVSTNGGSNLLIGTFADARGGYRRPGEGDGCAHTRGEVARDRCMSSVARTRIAEAPIRWLALAAQKVAVSFAWEHDPMSYALGRRARAPLGYAFGVATLTAAWWALVGFALWAWRRRAVDRTATRIAMGSAAVSVLTHAVFLGADRYHLLLVPLLAPSAAAGWHAWRMRRP